MRIMKKMQQISVYSQNPRFLFAVYLGLAPSGQKAGFLRSFEEPERPFSVGIGAATQIEKLMLQFTNCVVTRLTF